MNEVASGYVSLMPSARGFGRSLDKAIGPEVDQAGRKAGAYFSRGMKNNLGNGVASAAGHVGSKAGEAAGDGFLTRMRNKVASGARAIFMPLAAGTAVLGGLAIAGGRLGLSVAAGNEQAQISFSTMLGSAKKADAFIRDMQAFAAKTPFDFPGLQESASSLISAGIDVKKVIPIMTTLGDVTSGMGTGSEGIKRATIALQQMNAAGRITGEDLNQLRDAGIPVYDLLSKATGKSKAEVVALAQAGKLGKKELGQMMTALETGKGLERFSGLMDAQSASLTGMVSTFKDTLGQGLARAMKPFLPLIKSAIGGATSFIEGKMPTIVKATTTMAGGLRAFGSAYQAMDGDVTSSGFAGKMEVLGFKTHLAFISAGKGIHDFRVAYKAADDEAASSSGMARLGEITRKGVTGAGKAIDWLRGKARDLFPRNATGGADFAGVLDRVQVSAKRLWPSIRDALAEMKGLRPVLSVAGAALRFVADHADTLIKYMPLLISAFVAYKAAQAASNVVALAHLPIAAATVVANLALASANKALAVQLAILNGYERVTMLQRIRTTVVTVAQRTWTLLNTAATKAHALVVRGMNALDRTSLVLRVRSVAVMVAQRVATIAASAATKVWAATQWLLNAALSANPIGLVVVAVAALAAGIIYAYKHSETFRKIVQGAFEGIQAAGSFMWNDVLKPIFRTLVAAWLAVAGAIIHGAESAFGWVPGIGSKIKKASRAFDQFKNDVNAALADTDKSYTLNARIQGQQSVISSLKDTANLLNYIKENGHVDIGVSGRGVAGREHGGRVQKGTPYIVGERRKELFVPDQNGTVVPEVPALGSGKVVNVTVNVYNPVPETVSTSGPKALKRAANRIGDDG